MATADAVAVTTAAFAGTVVGTGCIRRRSHAVTRANPPILSATFKTKIMITQLSTEGTPECATCGERATTLVLMAVAPRSTGDLSHTKLAAAERNHVLARRALGNRSSG